MKFTCDRCGKRFSSVDEPMPGRVYRIRCRCGNAIEITVPQLMPDAAPRRKGGMPPGDAGADGPAPAPPRSGTPAGDAGAPVRNATSSLRIPAAAAAPKRPDAFRPSPGATESDHPQATPASVFEGAGETRIAPEPAQARGGSRAFTMPGATTSPTRAPAPAPAPAPRPAPLRPPPAAEPPDDPFAAVAAHAAKLEATVPALPTPRAGGRAAPKGSGRLQLEDLSAEILEPREDKDTSLDISFPDQDAFAPAKAKATETTKEKAREKPEKRTASGGRGKLAAAVLVLVATGAAGAYAWSARDKLLARAGLVRVVPAAPPPTAPVTAVPAPAQPKVPVPVPVPAPAAPPVAVPPPAAPLAAVPPPAAVPPAAVPPAAVPPPAAAPPQQAAVAPPAPPPVAPPPVVPAKPAEPAKVSAADRREAARAAAAERKAEAARVAEERRAEAARKADEMRKAEAQRRAEAERAEAERRAEAARKAEAESKARADRRTASAAGGVAPERQAPAPQKPPGVDPALAEAAKRKEEAAPPKAAPRAEGLDPAEMQSVIRAHRAALEGCVATALSDPATAAYAGRKVWFLILVNPNGRAEAALEEPSLDGSAFGTCLHRAVSKMSFPAFKGEAVGARIPLVLGQKG